MRVENKLFSKLQKRGFSNSLEARKSVFLFPGQGSQKVGMMKEYFQKYSEVRRVFWEMDQVVGKKLSEIMFSGPEEELNRSENAQPAIMCSSVAICKVIEKEYGFSFSKLNKENNVLLGHSLGEFSALTAAGMFDLGEAIELVKKRGEKMQECVPLGGPPTAMIALIGSIDVNYIKTVLSETEKKREEKNLVADLANINSPQQVVLSGHKEALKEVTAILKQGNAKFREVPLSVGAPFHSRLMQPVTHFIRETLQEKEEKWNLFPPFIPAIMNFDCSIVRDDTLHISNCLSQLTTRTVLFSDCLNKLTGMGFTHFYEIGFGDTLSSLVSKNIKGAHVSNMSSFIDAKDPFPSFLLNQKGHENRGVIF